MPRLASLFAALALFCALPAAAHAESLTLGAFGHGTLTAGGQSCTTSATLADGNFADCRTIEATSFDSCEQVGTSTNCTITVAATAPAGWVFAQWAAGSDRCPNSTFTTCTITTSQTACDSTREHCTTTEPGPFHMEAIFHDVSAPQIAAIGGVAENAVLFSDTGSQTLTFTTTDDAAGPAFACKRDGGAAFACATPLALNGLADGKHSVCVVPTDPSGHAGASVCRDWEQERNPTAAVSSGPPAAVSSTAAAFTYTSNKVGHAADGSSVSFECRLDGAAFAACPAAGTSVSGLADGPHEFAVRAQFHATGEAAAVKHASPPATYDWTVDTTAPQVTIASGPADGSTITDIAPTFAFAAGEPATFTCSVDGGPAASCASPFTLPTLVAGAHSFTAVATDAVGNVSSAVTHRFTLLTGLATLKDADHDGFPDGLDCNDANAGIHPGALEIPGNKVDENCDGVVAPFPRVTALISASGVSNKKQTKFQRVLITGVPAGGKVELRCIGGKRDCSFTRRAPAVKKGRANGISHGHAIVVKAGGTLEIRVTAAGMIGRVRRLKVTGPKFPKGVDLCLAPGAAKPSSCQ